MARCEQGYLCDVCGLDVEAITESDLYLRYVMGEVSPLDLPKQRERHIRCDPALAQWTAAGELLRESYLPPAQRAALFRAVGNGEGRLLVRDGTHSHLPSCTSNDGVTSRRVGRSCDGASRQAPIRSHARSVGDARTLLVNPGRQIPKRTPRSWGVQGQTRASRAVASSSQGRAAAGGSHPPRSRPLS